MKAMPCFFLMSLTLLLSSCSLFEKEKGCTESNALNLNYSAEEDDGSCEFSKATFYASFSHINNVPISKVEVFVNGNFLGIPEAFYSNGPGNCSAIGTLPYQFQNGNSIDWNSKIYMADGVIFLSSGEERPKSYEDCIKVNVTQ